MKWEFQLLFAALAAALNPTILPTVLNKLTTATGDCSDCDDLLTVLKQAADTDEDFISLLTGICDSTAAEDPDVCAGLFQLEGPHIANAVRNLTMGSRSATLFCINNLGLCTYPPAQAYNISLPPLPSKSSPPASAPSSKAPIKIVQISDIHVDHNYTVGAATNCTKNICCRAYTPDLAPGNNTSPAGPNGASTCDSTTALEDSMYAAIRQFVPDRALTIFTGDIVEGDTWETTEAGNEFDIRDAYERMASLEAVFPAVGNHESSPVNQFSFPTENPPANISSQWVYDTLASSWAPFLPAGLTDLNVHSTGSYGATPSNLPGLRIISLNTMLSMKENYHVYLTPTPGLSTMNFVASELARAEKAGQKALIIGHMPMGHTDSLHDPSRTFHEILLRFKNTVMGNFWGHTHKDEWEITYEKNTPSPTNSSFGPVHEGPVVMGYISGAMTPTSGNPNFRVYTFDPETFAVLDFEVFITNISHPSFFLPQPPTWQRYYSARDVYGPLVNLTADQALTPQFWDEVTSVLETNITAYNEYLLRKFKGVDMGPCTGACMEADVCQLRAGRSEDNCEVFVPGTIGFDKRDGDSSGSVSKALSTSSECSHAHFGDMMKRLVGSARQSR